MQHAKCCHWWSNYFQIILFFVCLFIKWLHYFFRTRHDWIQAAAWYMHEAAQCPKSTDRWSMQVGYSVAAVFIVQMLWITAKLAKSKQVVSDFMQGRVWERHRSTEIAVENTINCKVSDLPSTSYHTLPDTSRPPPVSPRPPSSLHEDLRKTSVEKDLEETVLCKKRKRVSNTDCQASCL